jgi:recombination protein RecA
MTKKKKAEIQDNIDDVMEAIHKEYGVESLRCGIDEGGVTDCPAISTRCLSLDLALGVGGVPQGRITEIFGPESSGKTTLALTVVAEAQARGGRAAFLDVEHAVDLKYAKAIGVDLKTLLFAQPDSGEQALSIAEKLILSRKVMIVVVDSVAALVTEAELAGELTDHNIAPQARLMSTSLRRLKGYVNRSETAMVFINQIREKTGVIFGNPEVQPGGRALKFYASIRMDIRRSNAIKGKVDGGLVGNDTKVRVVKNKVAPPFKTAIFPIIYGKGICTCSDLIACAVKAGVIEKSSSWFSYNDTKIGNGVQATVKYLESNPDIMIEVDEKTRSSLLPKSTEEDADDTENVDDTEDADDTEDIPTEE